MSGKRYALKEASSTDLIQVKVHVERGQFIRSCQGEGRLLVERVQLNRRMYTMKGVSSSDLVMVKIGYSLKRVQFNRPVPAKVRDERVSSTGLV